VPGPDDWVRAYFFVEICKGLNIASPKRVPYGKVLTPIFGNALRLDKCDVSASIRFGWEDWLREVVPLQYGSHGSKSMTKVELKSRARSHQDRIELRKKLDLLDKFDINDFDDLGDIANSA